jgi:hypothetical protein
MGALQRCVKDESKLHALLAKLPPEVDREDVFECISVTHFLYSDWLGSLVRHVDGKLSNELPLLH